MRAKIKIYFVIDNWSTYYKCSCIIARSDDHSNAAQRTRTGTGAGTAATLTAHSSQVILSITMMVLRKLLLKYDVRKLSREVLYADRAFINRLDARVNAHRALVDLVLLALNRLEQDHHLLPLHPQLVELRLLVVAICEVQCGVAWRGVV